MKTNIKLWTMGLMTAALLGNTACTDLLHESYGQVVSEDYVPKTEEDVSYLVNAAYIPWRETLLQWNGVVRAQELCADQDVLPARDGIGWVDGYIYSIKDGISILGLPRMTVCFKDGNVRTMV